MISMLKKMIDGIEERTNEVDLYIYKDNGCDVYNINVNNLNTHNSLKDLVVLDVEEGILLNGKNNYYQCTECNNDFEVCNLCEFKDIKENLNIKIYDKDIKNISFNVLDGLKIDFYKDNNEKIDYILFEFDDRVI